jgi:23S rRNA (pseudouridine1915-N3)-methyltransferase
VKVYLYYIGKPRDRHANAIADDFVARTAKFCTVEMCEILPRRADPWGKHPAARKILLDPAGRQMDSAAFTALVSRAEMEGRDLLFAVGDAEGFPAGWRGRADMLLSLSAMTWPHELARAMLAEQVYRAFATLRGHPYPR